MANKDRMTIYMNEQDKATVQVLINELSNRGIDLRNKKSEPSVSELFRYLVQKELKKVSK